MVTRPIVTDHALLRFLERAGGLDVEGVRRAIADGLGRAHAAARAIGAESYQIRADGFVWVMAGDKLVTVHEDGAPKAKRRR
jgi:hypothetical protein